MTSPEVNEVFKRNSHLYHGDVTIKQLPVAAIVNPITLEAYQPPPPGESSVDPPPVDTTMNKRSLSFEWPANNEEAEVLSSTVCSLYTVENYDCILLN